MKIFLVGVLALACGIGGMSDESSVTGNGRYAAFSCSFFSSGNSSLPLFRPLHDIIASNCLLVRCSHVSIGIVSPTSNERFEAGDAISFVIEVSGAVSSCFFF